jgi:NAD+ synthase (glutamine-hydrolysing)
MVLSYFLAQLLCLYRTKSNGFLIVLGSSNADESLRGYFTKFDCSSADINPIGTLSKFECRTLVEKIGKYCNRECLQSVVQSLLNATPTAELVPLSLSQNDEDDMGITYQELQTFGKCRTILRQGPRSMYFWLVELAEKNIDFARNHVIKIWRFYCSNRHKTNSLPLSCHLSNSSTDDSRFDQRPVLYPDLHWQFENMNLN